MTTIANHQPAGCWKGTAMGLMSTFFITLLVLLTFFNRHLFDPDKHMIDHGHDGFKNYYTFSYFVNHGSGMWFDGMAYPYGDHVIYADAQPAISLPLQFANKIWPWIGENTVLIVNWLMIVGMASGACIIFLIFQRNEMEAFWSIPLAIGITLLSPQIFRMSLHHCLTYVFVIPSLLHLFDYSEQSKPSLLRLLFSAGWLTFIAFIHPYYLFMAILFWFGIQLVRLIKSQGINWYGTIIMMLPVFSLLLYMHCADPFDGRPEKPYGDVYFRALVHDLFLPYTGILKEAINTAYPEIHLRYEEGSAYIGLAGVLYFLFLLFCLVNKKFRSINRDIYLRWLAVVPITLFALQIPFMWIEDESLRVIPFISQFRGTGRFAWVFYYVISIYGAIGLYRLVTTKTNSFWQTSTLILLIGFYAFDAGQNLMEKRNGTLEFAGRNVFKSETQIAQILEASNIDAHSIKAVITVPPSTIGYENIRLSDDFHIKIAAWSFAIQKGIPTTSINMSRTPTQVVTDILALVCNDLEPKPVDIPVKPGPHLIIIPKKLLKKYGYLTSKATSLGGTDYWELFLIQYHDLMDTKTLDDRLLAECSEEFNGYFESFDDGQGEDILDSDFILDHKETWTFDVRSADRDYELSCWSEVSPSLGGIIAWNVTFLNQAGESIGHVHFSDRDMSKIESLNGWIRLNQIVSLPQETYKMVVELKAKNGKIDNLMIRPLSEHYYAVKGSWINYDNHLMPKSYLTTTKDCAPPF